MLYVSPLRLIVVLLAAALFALLASPGVAAADNSALASSPQPATVIIPHGGWIAYGLSHPGDGSKFEVVLSYSPTDDPNDRGLANGSQITLAIYSPSAPPPTGKPIAWAGGNGGQKRYTQESALGGEYVLIVNNWDSRGRQAEVELGVVSVGPGGKATVGGLRLISASDGAGDKDLAEAGPEAEGDAGGPAPDPVQTPSQSGQSDGPKRSSAAKRVGIQAGHWKSAELPDELARLRTSTGTAGGGVPEWQLNLDVAKRVAALLEAQGIAVDIIPSTVSEGYTADAFVALHADGDRTGRFSGFKLAHGRWSGDPVRDKALLEALTVEYQATTGLSWDNHVSRNMTGYYAFSNRRFQHAVAAGTPAVILEMGFMTNRSDLRFLLEQKDTVASGIANGIIRFLGER